MPPLGAMGKPKALWCPNIIFRILSYPFSIMYTSWTCVGMISPMVDGLYSLPNNILVQVLYHIGIPAGTLGFHRVMIHE